MNIIADVAGRFDELMKLIQDMDKVHTPSEELLFVGDLHDRGSQSKEVIEWIMAGGYKVLQSNHGDMFVDFYEQTNMYGPEIFLANGGVDTLVSYGLSPKGRMELSDIIAWTQRSIPKEHIEWLKGLPFYYEEEGLFVSHAPRHPDYELKDLCFRGVGGKRFSDFKEYSLLWNRNRVSKIDGTFQVWGHNSRLDWYGSEDARWGVCIDDCHNDRITGINWPSKKLYFEEYQK